MRYITTVIAIAALLSSTAMAQGKLKFGHINSQELLEAMPEKTEADKALEDFAKQLETQLGAMTTEFESKIQDYRANEAMMSDIIAQTKAEEIQNLEQRIQSFQQNAQTSLGQKEAEVYQPILDKAKAAIEAVSEEGGYSYVFDSSAGTLLYQPDSDDIMELVKKKLGITNSPPPSPPADSKFDPDSKNESGFFLDYTIGIFDSGVGGLTIWNEIHELLPEHNTIYLGDGINAPYGEKSKSEIISLSIRNADWLIDQGANMIVVACNTATTNGITSLRSKYSIPIIGIEPATKPAAIATKTGKIGILATKGTLASELFLNTSKAYRGDVEIIETVGTGLVDIIENRAIEEARPLLEAYLNPLVDQGVDNLVLGCTHYPFLIPLIKEIIPHDIQIIEPSKAIALRAKELAPEVNNGTQESGKMIFYTTAETKIMAKFLGAFGVTNPIINRVSFTP